ncbi:MAG: hypothetical protein ACREHV_01430 [Rhizomicrobium sp.]
MNTTEANLVRQRTAAMRDVAIAAAICIPLWLGLYYLLPRASATNMAGWPGAVVPLALFFRTMKPGAAPS